MPTSLKAPNLVRRQNPFGLENPFRVQVVGDLGRKTLQAMAVYLEQSTLKGPCSMTTYTVPDRVRSLRSIVDNQVPTARRRNARRKHLKFRIFLRDREEIPEG